MKKFRLFSLGFALLTMSFMYSCEQEELTTSDQAAEFAASEILMEEVFEEVDAMVYELIDFSTGEFVIETDEARIERPITGCATRVKDTLEDGSIQLRLTYNGECGLRKRNRTGEVVITFKGRRFEPGSSVTIDLVDYYVDGIKFEGQRVVENISESLQAAPKHRVTLTNGKTIWPDKSFALRSMTKTRTWLRAENPLNDETHVEGEVSGTNRRGVQYHTIIVEPLVYRHACAYEYQIHMPASGVKRMERDGKADIIVNFGEGDCDNNYTVNIVNE